MSKARLTSDFLFSLILTFGAVFKIFLQLVFIFWLNAGTPRTVTTEAQKLLVCLDCTVNIPSNLRVSALNAQEVIWFRVKESVKEQVENGQINSDYSLTLTHVRRSDHATYYARATNIDGESANSPQVDLMVIEKPGEKFIVSFKLQNDTASHFELSGCYRQNYIFYSVELVELQRIHQYKDFALESENTVKA